MSVKEINPKNIWQIEFSVENLQLKF